MVPCFFIADGMTTVYDYGVLLARDNMVHCITWLQSKLLFCTRSVKAHKKNYVSVINFKIMIKFLLCIIIIWVKIFIMNRYISKSYTTTKNTIDRQHTERGQL